MARVTINLPDEVERELRDAARWKHKSLSAYLSDLVTSTFRDAARKQKLLALKGQWQGLAQIDDQLPPLDDPSP